jgi:hypothetical protein
MGEISLTGQLLAESAPGVQMHRFVSGSFAADAIVNNAPNEKWFRRKEEFFGTFGLRGLAQLKPI